MAKAKRKAGEINSSSMADIAFLLLIFFLVTTTMDVDMGMKRTLPPLAENEDKPEDIKLNERNVLLVNVSRSGGIMVGKDIFSRADLTRKGEHSRLSKETYHFLVDEDRSEKYSLTNKDEEKNIIRVGNKAFAPSKGIVSLKADNETTFDVYMQVQDELTHAFNLYRNYVAEKLYGKSFGDLDEEQQEFLRKKLPPKISEAEPNDQTTK
jgi:biopolymer transport protein ExbD